MGNKKVLLFLCSAFLLIVVPFFYSFSDTVRISQIDNTSLLVNQRVKVYVSVTDASGDPIGNLKKQNFEIYEGVHDRSVDSPENRRDILGFRKGININQGINLLLVIDNSGSMYWDSTGRRKNSSDQSIWRITYAKNAVGSLLKEIKNPLDRVGLVTFNVKVDSEIKPTSDKVKIESALEQIERPKKEEAYTELYETLYHSINHLRTVKGRKVIILLSDGVDYPLKKNPYFPKRHGIDGAIDFAQREGISLFTIGLSRSADTRSLSRIALETGGAHFSVYNPGELEQLYSLIRNQIINEYLLTYSAGMEPATKKMVRVNYAQGEKRASSQRFYFSGTIFGFPQKNINAFIFLLVAVSLLLLWILSRIKFEKRRDTPVLDAVTMVGKKTIAQTLPVSARKSAITIGVSPNADLTVAGDPKVSTTEAKIIKKSGAYTLVSSGGPVMVNNKPVKTKVLRSGDFIRVGSTSIVFDEGVAKDLEEKRKPPASKRYKKKK